MAIIHRPVMLEEAVNWLNPKAGIFLDVTLGDGGHSEALLESNENLEIIATDRDKEAIENASKRLERYSSRITFVQARFSEVTNVLKELNVDFLDGVIADLGISSRHVDTPSRGFSFKSDGPLDMRMGDGAVKAEDIINAWDEKELADLFYELGEERKSRRIAKAICKERKNKKFETTLELANFIAKVMHAGGKIHPATRVFQALRIFVNDELNELDNLLATIPGKLAPNGRFVVISYHSLEDRKVKHTFRDLSKKGFILPTKKAVQPSKEEVRENRRARSAKLRVLERAA